MSITKLLVLYVLCWNPAYLLVDGFDFPKATVSRKRLYISGRNGRASSTSLETEDPSVATRTTEKSSVRTRVDEKLLRQLENCETGTSARRLLEQALFVDRDDESGRRSLFGSIQIPAGLSDRAISDGDLAIQTKVRNKKYGIFDLVDTNGDRDADRASAAVFGVFVSSSLSAIVANENLPGPEIFRFVVVWLLSFAPL